VDVYISLKVIHRCK